MKENLFVYDDAVEMYNHIVILVFKMSEKLDVMTKESTRFH